MMDLEHDEYRSMIAAYALGALPAEEERALRAHIVTCEECMAEADRFFDTSSKLALAVEPEELPPGLADRVLAAVREQRPAPAPTAAPRRRFGFVPVFAAAALSLAVIVMGFFLIDTRNELRTDRQVLAALLRGDEGFELTGEGAVARLVPTTSGSTLVATGLGEAPDDRVYQLWLLRGEEPVSGGVFEATGELSVFRSDLVLEDFTGAAVTIEPTGGSDHPTGRMVITSS
ncbi:MAG: anti-sigma factor [Actinomycetota bacterium]